MTGATKWAQVAMLFVYMLTMGGTWSMKALVFNSTFDTGVLM